MLRRRDNEIRMRFARRAFFCMKKKKMRAKKEKKKENIRADARGFIP